MDKSQILATRVILKKHDVKLAETMFSYVEQDRTRLERYMPWVQFTRTVDDERAYIESTHAKWDQYEFFDYGIFLVENGQYLGNVGVHSINWLNSCCEIGYWILGRFEGHGYISEAVEVLTNACHEFFNRVEIRCDPTNSRSARVPEILGFHFEGCLKQNIFLGGEFRDSLIYSHLRGEGKIISRPGRSSLKTKLATLPGPS